MLRNHVKLSRPIVLFRATRFSWILIAFGYRFLVHKRDQTHFPSMSCAGIHDNGGLKSITTLDIGCGHSPRGDVNVDLFVNPTAHRSQDQRVNDDKRLDTRAIPNSVRADAEFIPFRNDIFDSVVTYHTIEHTNNPLLMLSEMKLVCEKNGSLTSVCPSKYDSLRRIKVLHRHQFDKESLGKALAESGVKILALKHSVYYTLLRHRRVFQHVPLFRFPVEITAIALK